ncbi:MAG TPA: hypothetical protein PKC28_13090 [Bdellovibrionales bacterium]|nr:hypothetical protein [Bdellovibrionales bacterium]
MKILVVSLLRLGDAIMLAPIVNGLARGRADARVDMLTFKPVDMLHAMMPNVRRWWTMDRQELQAGLGRADLPALTSFAVLDEQLRAIDAEKYDLIINLTQTHFSAYVMGLLKSPDRLGLTFDLKGQTHFHSPWFRHLNESLDGGPIFHFTDVFMHACGLGSARADWSMPATEKGGRGLGFVRESPRCLSDADFR